MTLGVSLKIAGADEGLGALRAGNLGLNFHGEDGRGWDGRVRAVHGARVCACYSICSSRCLVRREDAVVSGGNINLAGCCSANIGVRDIDGGGMFLANIDSMVVMRRRRGIPDHTTCLKVGRDVLVKKRFASAGDFATNFKANIEANSPYANHQLGKKKKTLPALSRSIMHKICMWLQAASRIGPSVVHCDVLRLGRAEKGVQKTASTDEAEDSGRPISAER